MALKNSTRLIFKHAFQSEFSFAQFIAMTFTQSLAENSVHPGTEAETATRGNRH